MQDCFGNEIIDIKVGYADGLKIATLPPEPIWEMTLCDSSDVLFRVAKAPNRFHRFMQKLVLGIQWNPL